MVLQDRKYTKDHEWVKIDGGVAEIGLTDYAQQQLGDIVFVELPDVGDEVEAGGRLAVVESVKAASEVYCAVGGEVIEANADLEDTPEKINEAPWETWIVKVRVANVDEGKLMDADAYQALLQAEGQPT
jgi:glycine cleavage system H protein